MRRYIPTHQRQGTGRRAAQTSGELSIDMRIELCLIPIQPPEVQILPMRSGDRCSEPGRRLYKPACGRIPERLNVMNTCVGDGAPPD